MSQVLRWIVLSVKIYCILTAVCLFLAAALAVYRVTLHPLARSPGPMLAAATGWYETYYDCFLLGKFSDCIDRLHKEYGKNNSHVEVADPFTDFMRACCSHQSLGDSHQRSKVL